MFDKEKLKNKPIVGERQRIAVVIKDVKPIIVDETHKEFPRQSFLDRLEQSGMTKVTMKPVVKASTSIITQEVPEIKKARKIVKKRLIIIPEEKETNKELEQTIEEPKIIEEPLIYDRSNIVLGPETSVEFEKRLPKKDQSVILKTSSYYMNNRELFVNFINSLFEPYSKEIRENSENISCDTIGQGDFSLSHSDSDRSKCLLRKELDAHS